MTCDFINELRSKLLPLEEDPIFNWSQFNKDADSAVNRTKELANYLEVIGKAPLTQIRPASVLISLVKLKDEQWSVVFTERAKHLKNHAGEICFPGGRFEKGDVSLQQTAIRETKEEIGLNISNTRIIGRLPRQITISQYFVTPYVAVYDSDLEFKLSELTLDKNEVENVFTVPLNHLLNDKNHHLIERSVEDVSFAYYSIKYGEYDIWGATAKMLVNFSQLLK